VAYQGPYVSFVEVNGLQTFTNYEFKIESSTSAGTSGSNWVLNKTGEGVPTQVLPPTVIGNYAVTLRVLLNAPLRPNGVMTHLRVIVDGVDVGSYPTASVVILAGLSPHTQYSLVTEACTSVGCARSPAAVVTSAEAAPQGVSAPDVATYNARNISLRWREPVSPNGVLTTYALSTETFEECSALESLASRPVVSGCSYLVCAAGESACGTRCYDSTTQTCCNGTIYENVAGNVCCGGNYVASQPGTTCCGGRMVTAVAGSSCCGSLYAPIAADEICCDGVVGRGNQCCGAIPYLNTSTAPRVCCGGRVLPYTPQRQCCGGAMITSTAQCCTDTETGSSRAYTAAPGMTCCGTQQVFANVTR
jgi:hypothetical protein